MNRYLPPYAFVPHDWHQLTTKQEDITASANIAEDNLDMVFMFYNQDYKVKSPKSYSTRLTLRSPFI